MATNPRLRVILKLPVDRLVWEARRQLACETKRQIDATPALPTWALPFRLKASQRGDGSFKGISEPVPVALPLKDQRRSEDNRSVAEPKMVVEREATKRPTRSQSQPTDPKPQTFCTSPTIAKRKRELPTIRFDSASKRSKLNHHAREGVFRFFDLPAELRDKVYDYCVSEAKNVHILGTRQAE
ncbi:hypothetical protein LTR09_004924 [Extremus antarcticus]|uniref:Uncharacterized protein n=1 Tax=Extremus antarcticus TaxID=702011 RepID=A0AAJ0GCJ7_9PEZI|nr:hypothetical protein LTR09_004924 [Extremus antarcticus]